MNFYDLPQNILFKIKNNDVDFQLLLDINSLTNEVVTTTDIKRFQRSIGIKEKRINAKVGKPVKTGNKDFYYNGQAYTLSGLCTLLNLTAMVEYRKKNNLSKGDFLKYLNEKTGKCITYATEQE